MVSPPLHHIWCSSTKWWYGWEAQWSEVYASAWLLPSDKFKKRNEGSIFSLIVSTKAMIVDSVLVARWCRSCVVASV